MTDYVESAMIPGDVGRERIEAGELTYDQLDDIFDIHNAHTDCTCGDCLKYLAQFKALHGWSKRID